MKSRYSKMQEGLNNSGKRRCTSCKKFDWFIVISDVGKDKKEFYICPYCGSKMEMDKVCIIT